MSDLQTSITDYNVEIKKLSFLQRILSAFVSPGKLMADLAAKPRVLFPIILIALSQVTLYLLRLPLYQDFLRKTTQASSAFTESLTGMKMTPEMIEKSVTVGTVQSIIMTPLGALFVWLLTTVIFFAVFKIGGAKGKFKQYMSVTGYAYLIMALSLLITLVVSYFTGSLHQEMPLTSIATLLSTDLKGNFLYGCLRSMDVFGIWHYAVIAIGFTAISGFRKSTVYSIVTIVFLIGLILGGASEVAMGAYL